MFKKLQKRSEGFTIIEVMIVLAIAALILLIVLLAVPALQRNSRNTTIKNDASSVAGAINTYESDNNGTGPKNVAGTGTVSLSNDACSGTVGTSALLEQIKVNGSTVVKCQAAAPTTAATSTVFVVPGLTCSGSTSSRAYSIYYYVETSGSGTSQQCADS